MAEIPEIDGVIVHAVSLERVAADQQRRVLAALKELEREIVRKLASAETLTRVQTKKYTALLAGVKKSTGETYRAISNQQNVELRALQALEARHIAAQLNGQIGVTVMSPTITAKLAETIVKQPMYFGATVRSWWRKQGGDLSVKFAEQTRLGISLGESIDEMTTRITGTKANNFTDGIMSIKRNQAETLVRSTVIEVTNQASLDAMAELPMVEAIEWVSTLDGNTSETCIGLDGERWTLPDFDPIGPKKKAWPGPTAHFSCRSTQVPVLPSWEELGAKRQPVLPAGTVEKQIRANLEQQGRSEGFIESALTKARSSVDGPVPASQTFKQFLDGKSKTFRDNLLGPGRADLFNRGVITLNQLTDQRNRPLTIAQLEKRA